MVTLVRCSISNASGDMQCNCERPSTENLVQIRRNGLLQKIRKSKTNCIFADGNQGWKSSLKNLVWSIDLCHAK